MLTYFIAQASKSLEIRGTQASHNLEREREREGKRERGRDKERERGRDGERETLNQSKMNEQSSP